MNQLKAYEITIKGKLEAIPLPDMEDAIWARIEAQLDTDMPTDDGSNGPFDSPSGPWILGSSILAFLLTLITLYYTQKNPDNSSAGTENQNNTFQNSVQTDDSGPPGSNAEIQNVSPANSTGDLRVNEGSALNGNAENQNGGSDLSSQGLQNPQQNLQKESGDRQNLQPGINGQQNVIPGSTILPGSVTGSEVQQNPLQGNGIPNLPGSNVPQNSSIPFSKDQAQNNSANKPPEKDSVVTGKKSRGVKGVTDSDYRIVPKKDN